MLAEGLSRGKTRRRTGGCRKDRRCGRRALAGINRWTEDRAVEEMRGAPMGRSRLRVAVRALLKTRERTRRRIRRRTLPAPR
jgi:hypothetical protein